MSHTFSIGKLAVVGPGLLGGSLCLAARERGLASTVALWGRRPEVLEEAKKQAFADEVSGDLALVVSNADLVVLCTPIGVMPALLEKAKSHLKNGAVVTDVGSVKAGVVAEATAILRNSGATFVGAHPMAGSEQSGLQAARVDLFEDAVCLVTPLPETPVRVTNFVRAFWQAVGGRPGEIHPERHDEMIALVSHLPHLLAAVLVDFVCSQPGDPMNYSGSGFRDTTRVASGPVEMWREILATNRVPVAAALRGLIHRLEKAADLLETRESAGLERLLEAAKSQRDQFISQKNNG